MVDFVPFTSLLAGDNNTVYPANYVVLSGASGAVTVNSNIYISSGGNILVGGSTAPTGGNATVVINGLGTNGGGIELVGGSGGGGSMSGLSGGGINFNTFTGAIGSEVYIERVRIEPNGNVSIGTTIQSSPALVIQANAATGSSTFFGGNTFIRLQGATSAFSEPAIDFAEQALSPIARIAAKNQSNGGGSLIFINRDTSSTTSALTERMRIDPNGNVGINTTTVTAGYKLQVIGVISDGAGNVRDIVNNAKVAAYILAATDNGRMINITTGGITVNISTFVAGNNITIYNNSGVAQTITQGTSVTMYLAGSATTGNRTLAQRGICTIVCVVDSTTFVISGAGLT